MPCFRCVAWALLAGVPALAGLSRDCLQILKQQQKPAMFSSGVPFGQAPGPIVPIIKRGMVYLRGFDRAAKRIADQRLPPPCNIPAAASVNRVTPVPLPFDSADLNGDGVPDTALLDSSTNSVLVFLTRGDTDLLDPVVYRTGGSPAAVILADVNGDGRPDLITANQGNGSSDPGGITVRLGNGDGTFRDSFNYPAGNAPVTLAAADLNADGKVDLVTGNSGSGNISVLLGNGDGTFRLPVNYAADLAPLALLVTDLNADGKPDVAVLGSPSAAIALLIGNGDGTLQSPSQIPAGPGAGPGFLARADFNHDGKPDFAVAHRDTGTLSILLANPDGTYRQPVNFISGVSPDSIAFLDSEGNGTLDAILVDAATNTALLITGNADGTFAAPPLYPAGKSADAIATGDFDGDGKTDLVVIDSQSDNVAIWLGAGNDVFKLNAAYSVKTSLTGFAMGPKSVTVADFNGDGKLDLAIANQRGNLIAIFPGNGDGTLRFPTHYGAGSNPTFIAAGDFNGDGKLDLAVANSGLIDNNGAATGNVSILLGRGDGTFQAPLNYAAGLHPVSLAVADFNRDGKLDLAVANAGEIGARAGSVSILLGNGEGAFQAPVEYTSVGNPGSLAAVDLNGDGRLDLVVVSTDGAASVLAILIANADGTFRQPARTSTAAGSQLASVRDVDGDGKPDLLLVRCCAATDIAFLRGNGDGTFQGEVRFPGGPSPSAVAVADLNGDGRPDLIVADQPGFLTALLQQPALSPPFENVSSASLLPGAAAPESMLTARGARLATGTATHPPNVFPTTLAGTTVSVQDAFGIKRAAQLYYVSPTQVNYVVPSGTAIGPAAVTISAGDGASAIVPLQIAGIAPALFTLDTSGLAAANLLRVRADGTQADEPVAQLTAGGQWVAKPIDLGPDTDQLVLVLYGTGIRFRSSPGAARVTIGGMDAPVLYAADQRQLPGLDQVNVSIPRSLRGRGMVDIVLTVDGKAANTLRVAIQ